MSLLQDLVNGKDLTLSDSSKISVQYRVDENVLALSIGGNMAVLSQEDLQKLMRIESILGAMKALESKL